MRNNFRHLMKRNFRHLMKRPRNKSKEVVEKLLEAGDDDLKQFALQSDGAFQEIMRNFKAHMQELLKKAKASGALTGDEPEHMVLKCLLVIAANDFFPSDIGQFKKTLKNLQRFL